VSGYSIIRKIRYLEEECDKLGFKITSTKDYVNIYGDVVALKPKADCLPIYSRDAELFVGSIEDLERWLQGFHFARKYDSLLLGNKHDKLRDRKEQDYRNKQLIKQIKGEDKEYESL
jgi:hypothetical protein